MPPPPDPLALLAFLAEPGAHAPVQGLARAIQLSVGPVFLLTGISGLLGVLAGRLSRVVDRARTMQDQMARSEASGSDPAERQALHQEMGTHKRRMVLLGRAMQCATLTGLLVAAVVSVTFVSAVAVLDLAAIVVPLFVVAMASLMGALLLLLRETQLSTAQLRRRF